MESNSKYTLNIVTDNDIYKINFTTTYSPFYSSYRRVISGSMKNLVSGISKEQIEEEIYFNSLDAYQIAEDYDNLWGEDEEVPTCVTQYVTKKTQYNLLRDDVIISSSQINEARIADFTLKSSTSNSNTGLINELNKDLDSLLDCVKGLSRKGNARQQTFLKSESSSPYPLENREFRGF